MITIIPAIDIIDGKCVRLAQGDYARQTTYDADPADMVKRYADSGLRRIHVVDLDGARAAEPQNLHVLERMALVDGTEIEWGGGLKSTVALRDSFNAGAAYAVAGSIAAREPDTFAAWLGQYGPERLVLGADVRDGKVAVSGWTEQLDLGIDELTDRFLPLGLSQEICTDISRDGMLGGPATELYVRLQQKYPAVDFTVSGGIGSLAHVEQLDALGLRRVIIGKAIYEQRITLKELEKYVS